MQCDGSDFDDELSDFSSQSSQSELNYDDFTEDAAPTVTSIPAADLWPMVEDMVQRIQEVTGLGFDGALATLKGNSWNVEDAISGFLDPRSAKEDCAVHSTVELTAATADLECVVCMEDAESPGIRLRHIDACKHTSCSLCWQIYLITQVAQGNSSLTCIGTDCGRVLGHSEVVKALDGPSKARFKALLNEDCVTASANLKWCPTAECGTVIKAEAGSSIKGSVECRTCRSSFCFECGVEHQPAACEHMKQYSLMSEAEGETVSWLSANAKECPRCAAFIEKNGGCNWVKCYKCKYEFCWMCMRHMLHAEVAVAGGDHKCNVFKEGEDKQITSRDNACKKLKMKDTRRKFAHYHSRHQAHLQSSKLEEKLSERHRKQDTNVKGTSCKLLFECQGDALKLLRMARQTLCSSYIFGLYMEWEAGTSLKEVFEDLQHLLESRTEQLSHIIEKSIVSGTWHAVDEAKVNENRLRVMDSCAAVRTNQRNLIAATCQKDSDAQAP